MAISGSGGLRFSEAWRNGDQWFGSTERFWTVERFGSLDAWRLVVWEGGEFCTTRE